MTTLRKTTDAPVTNTGGRTRRFCVTSESVDRDNDILSADGWEFDEFRQNPVGLLFHDYGSWPVCRWDNFRRVGPKWFADATFASTPEGDTALALIDAGMLNACSVGFQPLEYNHDSVRGGTNYIRQRLLEISICPVPANPDALVQRALARGLSASTVALVQKTFGRKAGRRNSAADQQLLDQIHDCVRGLGSPCKQATADDGDVVLTLSDSGDDVVLHLSDVDPLPDKSARHQRFSYGAIAEAFTPQVARDLIVEAVSSALRDVPEQAVKEMARARGVIVD